MGKKLLLAMIVGLIAYELLGETENTPTIEYDGYQLEKIAEAKGYMKNPDLTNFKTAEMACVLGDVEVLKKMKQAGFDMSNENLFYFLLYAVEYGRLECCRYLIDQGADVKQQDSCGYSALFMAAQNGDLVLCKYLIEQGADVNAVMFAVGPILYVAAEHGYPELCKYLIEQGADVNADGAFGKTALHIAAESSDLEMCKYLIEHGADVNAADEFGWTALYWATGIDSEVCKYLIEHGADVNAADQYGKTALHIAAKRRDIDLCEYLIEHGADVNAADQDGKTALHIAAERRDLDLCEYLIGNGAEAKGMKVSSTLEYKIKEFLLSQGGILEKAKKNKIEQSKVKSEKLNVPAAEFSGTVFLPDGITLKMVKVEAGTFVMSKQDGENYPEEKEHLVTLTEDFYIGCTEVTQAQWKSVMKYNPSKFHDDDAPVECVNWYEVMKFCAKLNEMTKETRPAGYHYTLPTETQWEYACRGGKRSKGCKYSGGNNCNNVAWYTETHPRSRITPSDQPHAVGIRQPNELGLYDMSGNVYEWCLDDWQIDSRNATAEFTRDEEESNAVRAVRGGAVDSFAKNCRAADRRTVHFPDYRHKNLGFRLVLAPESYPNARTGAEIQELPPPEKRYVRLPEYNVLEMIKVEAGAFTMSRVDGKGYCEKTPHIATLTRDFYIGKTEVTLAQWKAVTKDNFPEYKKKNEPVVCSWRDAMKFCKKLNEMTEGKRPAGYHYTLPTETQWEYACRGGNRSRNYVYSGSDTISDVAWYGKWGPNPVAKKGANELGLYDMSGNVYEWCLDDWQDDSRNLQPEFTREDDGSNAGHACRGGYGSYGDYNECTRSSARAHYTDADGRYKVGFRLVLAPESYPDAGQTAKPDKPQKMPPPEKISVQFSGKNLLEMVKVESGAFIVSKGMVENASYGREHTVRLTKDFYLGETEVTQAQWKTVMGNDPDRNWNGDNLPVKVNWFDAMKFCAKLNEMTEGIRPAGYHYSLPTETQWEYACRGGNRSKDYKYSGSNKIDDVAWYYENSGNAELRHIPNLTPANLYFNSCRVHPVGTKQPNELGLFDMIGNEAEWCLDDWLEDSRNVQPEFIRDDDGSNAKRACRGGDCRSRGATASSRGSSCAPDYDNVGFRLALVPDKYY